MLEDSGADSESESEDIELELPVGEVIEECIVEIADKDDQLEGSYFCSPCLPKVIEGIFPKVIKGFFRYGKCAAQTPWNFHS